MGDLLLSEHVLISMRKESYAHGLELVVWAHFCLYSNNAGLFKEQCLLKDPVKMVRGTFLQSLPLLLLSIAITMSSRENR